MAFSRGVQCKARERERERERESEFIPRICSSHWKFFHLIIMDEKANVGQEDLFAKLADDILVSIISSLDMKEAAKISVFSHTCLNLWRQYSGSLNFDEPELIMELQDKMENTIPDSELTRFLKWVNQIVDNHRGPKIDELRVRFCLGKSQGKFIDKLLDFALARRVKRIDLDLQPLLSIVDENDIYCLPDKYLKFSKHLQNSTFRSLTSFSVKYVNVSGEFVEMLLFNCPLLEQLSIHLSDHLRSLKLTDAPLKLKHLEIYHCMNVEKVEVCAPNLLFLKYHGQPAEVRINNASCLTEVSIGVLGRGKIMITSAISSLSDYLPHLTMLHLKIIVSQVELPSTWLTVMSSLRQLHLYFIAFDTETVIHWTTLLEASPFLQKFTFSLELYGEPSGREIYRRQNVRRPFKNLKELEFIGFEGAAVDTELAMICLDSSPTIEKLVVDRRHPLIFNVPSELEEAKEKKAAEDRALELRAKLPANATFVLI